MSNRIKVVASASSEAVQSLLYNQLKGLPYIEFDTIYLELAEAVKATQTHHPDVVIIDMTGRELDAGLCIQTLGMDPENPFVIFALHGRLDHQIIIQAVQSGAKEFIHYPQEPQALELAFKRHLAILKRTLGNVASQEQDKPSQGKIIAVFSSKGGSGSSTVAVNLAHELFQSRQKPVVYFDLDQWYNNTAVLLGMTPDYSLGDLAENKPQDIDSDLIRRVIVTHDSGLNVVVGSKNILDDNDMMAPEILDKVLDQMQEEYDYIVIDLPTYVLDIYHNFIVERADQVLLVSSLDVPAMYRTCQYLELAKKYYPDIRKLKLVMNRWNLKAAYGMSNKNLEDQFQYPVYCRLANDWEINVEANSRGCVLSQVKPKSELVKNIQQLAQQILLNEETTSEAGSRDSDPQSDSLLGKLFGNKKPGGPNQIYAKPNS